jgi:hypothetical protein
MVLANTATMATSLPPLLACREKLCLHRPSGVRILGAYTMIAKQLGVFDLFSPRMKKNDVGGTIHSMEAGIPANLF